MTGWTKEHHPAVDRFLSVLLRMCCRVPAWQPRLFPLRSGALRARRMRGEWDEAFTVDVMQVPSSQDPRLGMSTTCSSEHSVTRHPVDGFTCCEHLAQAGSMQAELSSPSLAEPLGTLAYLVHAKYQHRGISCTANTTLPRPRR